MLFSDDITYKSSLFFSIFVIGITGIHFCFAEHIPLLCRTNVNCTDASEDIGRDYWFDIKDDNLDVTLTNDTVELGFSTGLTSLDDKEVPFFGKEIRVTTVDIQDAKLPTGSFKDALTAMNIVYFEKLKLYYKKFNNNTVLQRRHFEGLSDLQSLEIKCEYFELYTAIDLDFLRSLVNLKELTLEKMVVPSLPNFTKINKLFIEQGSFYQKSQPIGGCRNLDILTISGTEINEIPKEWLLQCQKLQTLRLEYLRLQKLPDRMLQGLQNLQSLTIQDCDLNELPSDLLSYTPNLKKLDLSHNWVSSLPKGFFANTLLLEELDLGHLVMGFDAGDEFNNFTNLKSLVLDGNYKYGRCWEDISNDPAFSTMPFSNYMPKLEYLSLQMTEVTRICPEWGLVFSSLKTINLTDHYITNLTYNDMQIISFDGWEVDMRSTWDWNNNLKAINFTEYDYNVVLQSSMYEQKGKILLNEEIACDCHWYWAIRTLKSRPGYVTFPNANCIWYDPPGSKNKMSTPIAETPESKLVCPIN